jgi:hypothetical protein
MRDGLEPSTEALGFAQLGQLRHRLDENILRQFLSFFVVSQSAQSDDVDGAFVPSEQLAKRFSVARLGRSDQISRRQKISFVFNGGIHGNSLWEKRDNGSGPWRAK